MDLYERLRLEPVRTEPDVWVRRLVVYGQISPEPKIIREVRLTKGLNIIWAEDPEDDIPVAEITGHSAGKTTFCRLLRYVLGEKTYGTRANMELITKAFPEGYVAAELFVRQRQWAVIRPIGNHRNSYVKADATIEELLDDRSNPAYQENYPEKIGLDALLDDLETGTVLRTGDRIKWGHLLAWCTRDQEARFQNIHEWRSFRSESDWPNFRFPKADPLFVMRTVLGLFLPDELRGEERLAKLLQEQEVLEKTLEEQKREPQFRVNLCDAQLRQRLHAVLPDETEIDLLPLHSGSLLPDLQKLGEKAVMKIEAEIQFLEDERVKLQDEIDVVGGKIRHYEGRLTTLDRLFSVDTASERELAEGLRQRQKELYNTPGFLDQ